MSQSNREHLERLLSAMDAGAQQRLYKRASQIRKLAQAKGKREPRRREVDDEGASYVRKSDRARGGGSLHDYVLRLLEEDEASASAAEHPAEAEGAVAGLVVSVEAAACHVLVGDEVLACTLSASIAALQQTELAVGDRVVAHAREGGGHVVVTVLPRTTCLSRPDPFHGHIERTIAANIDVAVVVVSVVAPPLHVRFIDRLLLAIGRGGARPVICVNKVDLLGDDRQDSPDLAGLAPYRAMGCPVHLCSASTGEGVPGLLEDLAGALCVFAGHSGVGKSSLLNAMQPTLQLVTNDVRAADGKGRHTTTASSLYRLPGGVMVIDTPGVRSFGLAPVSRREAAQCFPEIVQLAAGCRFRDCTHSHEPGCAVRKAIDQGRLPLERYVSYAKLR
jgi:ribosome biogenesis GTPase / thiamine phosphate phosphatase